MSKTLTKTAFRDVSNTLDLDQDADFIIPKVFNYGLCQDMIFVWDYYNKETIKQALTSAKYLEKHAFSLAQHLLHLPPEKFTCFTRKQSTPAPWNY